MIVTVIESGPQVQHRNLRQLSLSKQKEADYVFALPTTVMTFSWDPGGTFSRYCTNPKVPSFRAGVSLPCAVFTLRFHFRLCFYS